MLISYYANKKSSPRLPSWQPSLIFFNIPIESGSIIKPCTLKHFQVTYRLHKAGYWTKMKKKSIAWSSSVTLCLGPTGSQSGKWLTSSKTSVHTLTYYWSSSLSDPNKPTLSLLSLSLSLPLSDNSSISLLVSRMSAVEIPPNGS